jgi:hypothetical protein
MPLDKMLSQSTRVDLNADDISSHYAAGAIWNGDWYHAKLAFGWFGNASKTRHYAVSMGRQSLRYKYPCALMFLPMTSADQDGNSYLVKIPAGTVNCLYCDTYVTTRRLLMWEDQLETDADGKYVEDMPADVMADIKSAWRSRLESYKKDI